MEDEFAYLCKECGKYRKGEEGVALECCGRKMEQVPIQECLKDPGFAEHARNFEEDEPCDDGTG
jgi:hypothetical protein